MSTNPTPSPNDTIIDHAPDAGGYRMLPHAVLDLGLQKRRAIRDLEHGYGELSRDVVAQALAACDALASDDPGDILPLVIVYRCVDDGLPASADRDEPGGTE